MAKMHPLILLPALPPPAQAVAMESTTEHFFSPPTLGETLLPALSLNFPIPGVSSAGFPSAKSLQKPSDFSCLAFTIRLPSSWLGQSSSARAPTQICHSHPHPASTLSQPSLHRRPPHCRQIPSPCRAGTSPSCIPPCLSPGMGTLGEVSPWHQCGYVAPVPALRGGNGSSMTTWCRKPRLYISA